MIVGGVTLLSGAWFAVLFYAFSDFGAVAVPTSGLFALVVVGQLGIAVLALVAGINFLKLKAWSRDALEGLTWLFLVLLLGFTGVQLVMWLPVMFAAGSTGVGALTGVFSLFLATAYGVPLVLMLRTLRSTNSDGRLGDNEGDFAATRAPGGTVQELR